MKLLKLIFMSNVLIICSLVAEFSPPRVLNSYLEATMKYRCPSL
jgi:hypothetical protein